MNATAVTLELNSGVVEQINPDGSGSVQITATWRVGADVARRKATRFVGDRIGNLLFGGVPLLVVGERTLWRVPILLAYKGTGTVGQAGHLDIDADTGDPVYTSAEVDTIRRLAEDLASRYAPLTI